jgi:mannose-6-phosphate isomerase
MTAPDFSPQTDANWARTLLRATLDGWLASATTPTGLFYPYLDRHWDHIPGGPLTLVSQCRLIYNFCRGGEIFGDARCAQAARDGLGALRDYFHVASGRYRWAVTHDGAEVDPTPDAYGHAFCLLAQATTCRAQAEPSLGDDAAATWRYVAETLTDAYGGLLWRLDTHDAGAAQPRSQNPLMHTFEALIAWDAVDATGRARAAAQKLLGFVKSLSGFAAGALIEDFSQDWEPLPVERGGVVNLGHAFEWAWLLSEWHGLTSDDEALRLGGLFLRTGVAWGLDADGGVRASCAPDGRIMSADKNLWPQCEAIRALRRYVVMHGQTEWEEALRRALSFYRWYFVDTDDGGVFAVPPGLGQTPRLDKGDAWKLDYHTVGMCLELLRG